MSITFSTVTIVSSDVEAIRDAWERMDAAADRGEDFTAIQWRSNSGEYSLVSGTYAEMAVDENGDIWHDGLLLAYRDGDRAVAVGSGQVARIL